MQDILESIIVLIGSLPPERAFTVVMRPLGYVLCVNMFAESLSDLVMIANPDDVPLDITTHP